MRLENIQLTAHFSLYEMLGSQYATRHEIVEQFNPPLSVVDSLKALCENILEPLRAKIGQPIEISSGYRCERLNKAVGGAATSQHVLGQAADLKFHVMDNEYLFQKIIEMDLPFDQLIREGGTKDNPDWVHVSFSNRHRKQILVADFATGKAVYKPYNS